MSQIKETFNDVLDYANNSINNLMQSEQNYIIITFVIIFFILFSLITWIYSKLIIQNNACNRLNILYKENNLYRTKTFMKINNIDTEKVANKNVYDTTKQEKGKKYAILRNFYVKTAYNCCCIDGYKNNFVNECALLSCINLGARCLDFEIYSLNNKPIIAASTADNNFIKETYNYIEFDKVLNIIKSQAFYDQTTNCYLDPLYLHFRIMSENKKIFDIMGKSINRILYDSDTGNSEHFYNNVITTKDNYINNNYNGNDYLQNNIKDFKGKIIIICYCNNNNYIKTSELGKYTNILTNSPYFQFVRFKTIEGIDTNKDSLLGNETKNKLYMVLPDLNNKSDNYDFSIPFELGCHFIAMKFQHFDSNLQNYFNFFKNSGAGFSFVPKPEGLSIALPVDTEYSETNRLNDQVPVESLVN